MNTDIQLTSHEWSEEALFCKALLYFEQMESYNADDWQYGFWSALGLEFLARAALAHISPVFLANVNSSNNNDWQNLVHALGIAPTVKNFSPRSVNVNIVFRRLRALTPDFSEETLDFCIRHMDIRNSEIHSGNLAFESIIGSGWLPRFYSACKVLTKSMGKELEDLIPDSGKAVELIASLEKDVAQAVKKDIAAHKQVWSNKTEDEKADALSQASAWATRNSGHRTKCPSCDSPALLKGSPTGPVSTMVDGDDIVQRQKQLPSLFECRACGLRISGLSRLSACGLGEAFSGKTLYTPEEYFELYTEEDLEELRSEYEFVDYNE